MWGESQENEVKSALSEDATSEIKDIATTASSRAARRKGG